jgi:cellulose synthase/poly-beta-1,6-N-acetylglucosamine synthase-like glycosyltransferase
VILCLRGADPFLDWCLGGLVRQDYPNYRVLIVVDSAQDEALPQAESLRREHGKVRVEVLIRDRILPHCSRRASSFFCGLGHVPDEVDVMEMCDADAIPHSTGLRELVSPLQDPLTVATPGNRWYAPLILIMGGICRYFWNALTFRTMYKYRIP